MQLSNKDHAGSYLLPTISSCKFPTNSPDNFVVENDACVSRICHERQIKRKLGVLEAEGPKFGQTECKLLILRSPTRDKVYFDRIRMMISSWGPRSTGEFFDHPTPYLHKTADNQFSAKNIENIYIYI